ncbi:MAG TPA: TetR/AcrR family transcriptional regulator [Acidimicrobiales bacterium]|nr:TetR/AcrR family transcriptional regulator [Acidimicrobiales bacterium]
MTPGTSEVDGRAQRSARSRDAVVDAMLDLLDEGSLRPGAAEIAARAGVSVRTVFRHFEDLEQLFATAAAHQATRIGPLLSPGAPGGTRTDRIAALVGHRADLYERIGPVRRAAVRHEPFHQAVHEGLSQARRLLRRNLVATFGPELEHLDGIDRATIVASLETATSFAAWDNLRVEQRLSVPQARAALTTTLVALLEHSVR